VAGAQSIGCGFRPVGGLPITAHYPAVGDDANWMDTQQVKGLAAVPSTVRLLKMVEVPAGMCPA
jgi:hypothetical protein